LYSKVISIARQIDICDSLSPHVAVRADPKCLPDLVGLRAVRIVRNGRPGLEKTSKLRAVEVKSPPRLLIAIDPAISQRVALRLIASGSRAERDSILDHLTRLIARGPTRLDVTKTPHFREIIDAARIKLGP